MKRHIYIVIAMLLCMLSPLHATSGFIPDSLSGQTTGPSRVSSDVYVQGLSSSNNYVEKITFTNTLSTPQYFRDVIYYDGLGYDVLENSISASPSGNSIIKPIVYDNMRRADAVTFLPYSASSGSGSFISRSSALSAQESFYLNNFNEGHAYIVNEYDHWSGGMILSTRNAGNAWSNGAHDSHHNRRSNVSSDAVRKITQSPGSNSTVTTSGYHTAGSLIVDIVSDEEGDESIVFTDASGKKICTRQNDGSVNADTYFVYDVRDSLVCVIQPEGSASLSSNSTVSFTSDIAQKWFFTWKYDAWGNVTEYHVPGGGTTTYAYDSRNRLISEKTPKLSDLGATRVMTYDDCDRPTSEKYRRDSDGRVVQTHSWTYYPFGSSAPAGSRGLLQSETVWEIPQTMSVNQNSLVYCTRNYSYDSEGRVTGISESWSDGWTSNVSTTYDFVGNVTSVIESHSGPGGYSQTISTSYTYDQRGRKLTCSRSVSGTDTGNITLATVTYSYDELGRPSGKTVTGSNGSTLVYEDFDLDIHGWTTGISAKDNSNVPFFFENLSYTNPSRSISTARFDGNISEISSVHNVTPANGSSVAIYSYNYDGMKRLADARHTGISTLLTESDKNTERYISYDRNGNITGLTRYDSDGNADAITFSHTGNRMTSVNGNSYSYDSAGNMTHDGRKGLDISYNCLNLPSHAGTADGSSLTYTYLADGTKMLVTNSGRGFRYIGSFTYSVAGANNFALESIACDDGRYSLVGDDSSSTTLKDLFFVTDHLGNVRSIADVSPGLTAPVILEQNDYLPFGTKVQNSSYASITENRYRYAGKEEQNIGGINLSLLDFGARYYDHYAARWTSVDPMAGKYLSIGPYDYCANNPLSIMDDGGMDLILLGANNSSVTFTTALVNMSINVGRIGIDWNGNHTLDGDKYLSAALDIAGVFDPTGIADLANARLQYNSGDNISAVISAVGVFPVIGDLAKAKRISNDISIIGDAVKLAPFTKGNFRKNLLRLTGSDGVGVQAHHTLPVKFNNQFKKADINIHDPQYGHILESIKHNKGSKKYNEMWEQFFNDNPKFTKEQVLNESKDIMKKVYGE